MQIVWANESKYNYISGDGKLYPGQEFKELNGKYQLVVKEARGIILFML